MTYTYTDFGLTKNGPQFTLLMQRLIVHGFGPTRHTMSVKECVMKFQLAQPDWDPRFADGIVGPKTWARLLADPPQTFAYPADLFGKNWKVTVPYDGPDDGTGADEIKQPELATYSSDSCRLAADAKSVLFTVYHGSPTTSGSKNPRSELREMANQGLNLSKWDGRFGEHRMAVDLAVLALTKVKPHTVLGQIHNGTSDITTLRAEGVKDSAGNLTNRVKLYVTEGNDSHAFLIGEVLRGQRFTFAFDIADGEISFEFNGERLDFTVPAAEDCFFKVGAYLQSNPESAPTESRTAFTQVALFDEPEVRHAA